MDVSWKSARSWTTSVPEKIRTAINWVITTRLWKLWASGGLKVIFSKVAPARDFLDVIKLSFVGETIVYFPPGVLKASKKSF